MSFVIYRELNAPPVNRREILRYMGCKSASEETDAMIDRCLRDISDKLTYKACYCNIPVTASDDEIDLGFAKTQSKDLKKCLSGCRSAILFAATVGFAPDRYVMRYSSLSPALSLCFQAIGSERIESACDELTHIFEEEYGLSDKKLKPRFSPGYGDLPLSLQKDIFAVLECEKRLGVTLNDSLLMLPTKTVTAIIGIY